MSRFVQLHVLTSYPPSNLNRDDTGRPKTALLGDATRLRVSSQSQKRAWRTSEVFEVALAGSLGTRTKRLGRDVYAQFVAGGVAEKPAREWARLIAGQFGKVKPEAKAAKAKTDDDKAEAAGKVDALADFDIEQLAHFSPEELDAVKALVTALVARKEPPTADELRLLGRPRRAVDIAMFGRMLADSPEFNVEAAVQVAHAVTVHRAAVEDDYFSAVDDLNRTDSGAGHIGERGYGAGLYYLYLAIDRELLARNLGGDEALVRRALKALVEAVTKVSPTGMQASFASRAYAGYALAETGDQQPRSLVQAFLKPVKPQDGESVFDNAVAALRTRRDNFDAVYGACADARAEFNVETAEGSLAALADFVAG
ncbi:type I-E CRISPR-associated protein Cas7/Cse4/CasC [Derxia gummosa]|uniref:Type I-E CRISPR-associated protein Cas7/Cse4/CasC n=1 Tax=Derxia gummosa DSM 723 TaxID=1121388 RepID=A0A8B6X6F3_9BURK|nr:type I-E CRISPR-associated protein Cas7/Cse4/CasC [Derxia gummosa]